MTRIEQTLRKQLAEQYGLPMDAYRCHIESEYEDDPSLKRWAIFYRPDNGASVQVSDIYTDRGGWPVQWAAPELGTLSPFMLSEYLAQDSA